MEDVKRILVVVRMTKCCQKAIQYGLSLAQKHNAELFVMHVIHNPFGLEGWNIPMVSLKDDYNREIERTRKSLTELIRKENEAGLKIKEVLPEGDPTEEILKAIKNENIDLLLMTAHEEGRFEHFLFGSSNEAIIRKMPCSILLVKERLKSVWY